MTNTIYHNDRVYHLSVSNDIQTDDLDFLSRFYSLDDNAEWRLSRVEDVYQIESTAQKLRLCLDFRCGNYQHRNQYRGKEPLIHALKIKQKLPTSVIDATPGLLKDSFMLAGRGIAVTAIERNPLVYILVKRALAVIDTAKDIASNSAINTESNMKIAYHFGEAAQRLPDFSADIIYLDPMYPPKKKSAQVKKDMQILHHLVGQDSDAEQLLLVARRQNARVIVKRPDYAPPLGNMTPDRVSQADKRGATRFDIYNE